MLAFSIYASNGPTVASYDSAPNSLLALNLLENRRLDFDLFRASYFEALGGQYAFTEAPSGHLSSVFPIGSAILTLPLYAAFFVAQHPGVRAPPIVSPAFEPLRLADEKIAAAAVAALSVGLFLLCARELGNATQAALATAVYALATSVWSIGSQALWQHGPVNLGVLATLYTLLRALRARSTEARARWLVAAGVCAGFLPVIRPTAGLFSLAACAFVAAKLRDGAAAFGSGAAAGILPGLAWNAYFFHSVVGGYGANAAAYALRGGATLAALAALLVSPSRGVLIFSPVLVFSILGGLRVRRVREPGARLVGFFALACLVLIAQYAFFRDWWAGYSYGPRFLTDIAAVAALLVVYAIPARPLAAARRSLVGGARAAAFGVLFAFSAAVQFVGVNSGAAGTEWNAVPISVDRDPNRVWQLADSQIERNLRAAYFRFFAWNIAYSALYDRNAGARVRSLAPPMAAVAAGAQLLATAALRNDGAVPLYGYASGVYLGQVRIHVRILDAGARTVSEQTLYVDGSPATGGTANAVGVLTMPAAAGTYVLECAPVLVGGGPPDRRPAPFRIAIRVS